MSIQIYILSKLMSEQLYPYQLKKELSDPVPLAQMVNLSESKLYYHFEALKKQGLIEPVEVVKDDNRPEKQLFAITEAGRAQLPEKIYQLFDKAKTITDMLTGIFCIDHVNRDKVISILQYKLTMMERKEETIRDMKTQLSPNLPKMHLIQFASDYHEHLRQHEIESMKTLIEQLKSHE